MSSRSFIPRAASSVLLSSSQFILCVYPFIMALYFGSKRSAILAANLPVPVCDFLAPRLHQPLRASRQIRCLSATPKQCTAAITHGEEAHDAAKTTNTRSGAEAASNPSPRNKPLTQAQRDFLSSAVRPPLYNPWLLAPSLTLPSSASTKPAN